MNDCGISNRSSFLVEFLIQIRSFQEKLMYITPVSGSAEEHFHSIPTCLTLNPPGERKKKRGKSKKHMNVMVQPYMAKLL